MDESDPNLSSVLTIIVPSIWSTSDADAITSTVMASTYSAIAVQVRWVFQQYVHLNSNCTI